MTVEPSARHTVVNAEIKKVDEVGSVTLDPKTEVEINLGNIPSKLAEIYFTNGTLEEPRYILTASPGMKPIRRRRNEAKNG